MAPLPSRMPSLLLLLGLLAGPVTMALPPPVLCRREVHPELIRELWNRTKQLLQVLPEEARPSIKTRLLPKFCTKCSEKTIGWLEIREMIDIYQWTVFSKDKIQTLLPLHFPALLYRLQYALHNCVSTSRKSKWSKELKKLQNKIKRRHDAALKAVTEFTLLLRWTGELSHQRVF